MFSSLARHRRRRVGRLLRSLVSFAPTVGSIANPIPVGSYLFGSEIVDIGGMACNSVFVCINTLVGN